MSTSYVHSRKPQLLPLFFSRKKANSSFPSLRCLSLTHPRPPNEKEAKSYPPPLFFFTCGKNWEEEGGDGGTREGLKLETLFSFFGSSGWIGRPLSLTCGQIGRRKKLRGGIFKSFFDAMFEEWQGVVVVGCRGEASISFCLLEMHVF